MYYFNKTFWMIPKLIPFCLTFESLMVNSIHSMKIIKQLSNWAAFVQLKTWKNSSDIKKTNVTGEISGRLIEGEPEDEDGDSRVLDSGLDGNRDHVLHRAAAQSGGHAAESEAQPRQGHAG